MASNLMQLACEVVQFTDGKKRLIAIVLFGPDAEGDGATSPSCASINGSTNIYRASLSGQMARCFMQAVCEVGHFTHGNKLPTCDSFVCSWRRGRRGNVALFFS